MTLYESTILQSTLRFRIFFNVIVLLVIALELSLSSTFETYMSDDTAGSCDPKKAFLLMLEP